METYEYSPPEKKEESKNLDKLAKLFGKEETPPQPNIPPQPKIPTQPTPSPQTTGHAPAPKPAIELSPEQTREYQEEEERKESLQKQLGMRRGETLDREFRRIEQEYEHPQKKGGFDMVSLIITVVIAAVTLMIGLVVIGNMTSAVSSIPEATPTVQEVVAQASSTAGTAFNLAALGLFIMAAVFIVSIMANVLGGSE
jgi:hypothetical protein